MEARSDRHSIKRSAIVCRPSLAVKDLELAEAVGNQPEFSSKSVATCFGVRGGRIIKCVYVVCRHCSAGNGERDDGEKRIIGKR